MILSRLITSLSFANNANFLSSQSLFAHHLSLLLHMASQHSVSVGECSLPNNYSFIPIGYINSCFKTKNGTPRQPTVCSFAKARLKIEKSVFQRPDHSLEGLHQFSHVWLIYVFHQNGNKAFTKAKVKPPRLNGQKTGVFACRSPYRPNPIGLTLAKLDSVTGDTLHLSGIDIIDGTPVLDIKPYIPAYDCVSYSSHLNTQSDANQLPTSDTFSEPDLVNQLLSSRSCKDRDLSDDINQRDNGIRSESDSKEDEFSEHSAKVGGDDDLDQTDPANQDKTLPDGSTSNVSQVCDVEPSECEIALAGKTAGTTRNTQKSIVAEHDKLKKEQKENCSLHCQVDGDMNVKGQPPANDEKLKRDTACPSTLVSESNVNVGGWVTSPPIADLKVRFTPGAVDDMQKFQGSNSSQGSSNDKFSMEFFKDWSELKEAIASILSADPRSTYRRNSCSDKLYFFPLDNVHITCWFSNNFAEVLRVQPLCDADIPKK